MTCHFSSLDTQLTAWSGLSIYEIPTNISIANSNDADGQSCGRLFFHPWISFPDAVIVPLSSILGTHFLML